MAGFSLSLTSEVVVEDSCFEAGTFRLKTGEEVPFEASSYKDFRSSGNGKRFGAGDWSMDFPVAPVCS